MIRQPRFKKPFFVVAILSVGALALARLLSGCGQMVPVGVDDALVSAGGGGAGGSGSGGSLQIAGAPSTPEGGEPPSQGGAPACVPIECRGKPLHCGDCLDNDDDGVVDALDPDCLGPCDDDEEGLSSGMVVTQSPNCRLDCYFDGDSGVGNDGCDWSHKCDEVSVAPDYPPTGEARCEYDPGGQGMALDCEALESEQSALCHETCLPLVPNGCDCFGCCELADGKTHFIGLGRGEQGCQRDNLDDPLTCPPCTQVPSCLNPCDQCEVCVGREPDPSCGGGAVCPPGQAACTSDAPCDYQEYCVTGCCVRPPEPT